ncbi:flagella synthesis protein FlgN [Methylotenera sp.]|uniref:flagella synthesis protein FlgN n=1 Tax=Methylotenera sp. TaxID=2051956 RepID=UPI002731834E|nr:flagellar protein FlgN [Methylotenera sp.]MDP2229580.1 flagellar protein FlgN [Methylotenera sp.]MDP3140112.1 flagellar protein FlgN [Methylotenera sp.]
MNITTSNQAITFEQDAQLVNNLLELLTREQSSLVMVDVDAIEALMEEKSELLQHINTAAKSRYAALAASGFEQNESGMTAWLKSQAKPALNTAWDKFQKSISQAKEMNRMNGMLISKHFNRNQQLLNHLQGNSGAGDVYSKSGQAKSYAASRSTLMA